MDFLELLQDGNRLVTQFFDPISSSCLHVYFSALPLCPTESPLRRTFAYELTGTSSAPAVVLGARKTSDRRLREFEAHNGKDVKVVDISPDGALIATSGEDQMVELWDASSFVHLHRIGKNLPDVLHLKFSPDGRRLACLSGQRLLLWTVSSGALVRTFNTGIINSFFFTLDGMQLVTPAVAPRSGALRVWEVSSGTSRDVGPVGEESAVRIHAVTLLPDGRLLATITSCGHLSILDTTHFTSKIDTYDVAEHYSNVNQGSIVFAPNGTHVLVAPSASGITTPRLIVCNAKQPSEPWQLAAVDLGISETASIKLFSSADAVVVCAYHRRDSGSQDYSVSVSALDTGSGNMKFLFQLWAHGSEQLEPMACSADGTRIVTADQFGAIHIWDCALSDGDDAIDDPPSTPAVIERAVLPADGSTMLAWSQDQPGSQWPFENGSTGTLRAYDTATWIPRDVLGTGTVLGDGTVSSAALRRILVPSLSGTWWWIFDYMRSVASTRASAPSATATVPPLWCNPNFRIPPATTNTVTGVTLTAVAASIQLLSSAPASSSFFRKVAFTEDGRCMITTEDIRTAATDGDNPYSDIFVWDLPSFTYVRSLPGPSSSVDCIALSSDGTWIASVAAEVIQLQDLHTGVALWTVLTRPHEHGTEGHEDLIVDTIAFSPTGNRLACRHYDAVITLLNATNGVQLWATGADHPGRPAQGYYCAYQAIAFTSDGTIVISTEGDLVSFWDAETGDILQHIHDISFLQTVCLTADGSGIALSPKNKDGRIARLWTSADDLRHQDGPQAGGATQRTMSLGPSAEQPAHYRGGDGWVYEMNPERRRRLFWVPSELGPIAGYCPRRYIAFLFGQVVDITDYCKHLDGLVDRAK